MDPDEKFFALVAAGSALVTAALGLGLAVSSDLGNWEADVTVFEGEQSPNMEPGQRLDVVMHPDRGTSRRCADMGGTMSVLDYTWVCMNVDF